MVIKYKKLDENAVEPTRAEHNDAGFDLTAISFESGPGYIQYNTGIAVQIPDGHVGLLYPRSSITKKNLMLKNSVGVIDAGYRGELVFRFIDFNLQTGYGNISNPYEKGKRSDYDLIYDIGERVGQLVIMELPTIEFQEVEELDESTRGENGFGSTGQ